MKGSQLPENEHSRELFAYFGLAVYYGQAIEQQLTNLLVLTKLSQGKTLSDEELADLYQRKLSNSLGQLIRELSHYFPFSDEETRQLQEVWKQRNHIVHDYFKERIQETFTPAGRTRMIRELKRFKNKARRLEVKLQGYCDELYMRLKQETDPHIDPDIEGMYKPMAASVAAAADAADRPKLPEDGTEE